VVVPVVDIHRGVISKGRYWRDDFDFSGFYPDKIKLCGALTRFRWKLTRLAVANPNRDNSTGHIGQWEHLEMPSEDERMKAPSISVGLPVYNAEAYVRVAIESILNQTHQDWELIICDNASTDSTQRICEEYAARDSRLRYLRNPANIGAANNFCRTFDLSRGKYFKWIASDDYCGPEFLERCKRMLDNTPDSVLCTTKATIVDRDGKIVSHYAERQDLLQPRASERFVTSMNRDSWCIAVYGLMRAEVVRHTPLMGNFRGSDKVFLGVMSLHGCFSEVPEYLQFRRFHPDAYSYTVTAATVREFYAPGKKQGIRFVFHTWRHIYEYLRAFERPRLPFNEKLKLIVHVLRMAWWCRGELVAEITTAFGSIKSRT